MKRKRIKKENKEKKDIKKSKKKRGTEVDLRGDPLYNRLQQQ